MTLYSFLKKTPFALFLILLLLVAGIQLFHGNVSPHSLYFLPLYVIGGYFMNFISYWFINRTYLKSVINVHLFLRTINRFPGEWAHQFKVAVLEEIIWRVVPIALFRLFFPQWNIVFFILALTFLFTIVHFYNKDIIYIIQLLEFYLYFLIITLLYIHWSDIVLLVSVHLLRNQLIFFCRTCKVKAAYGEKRN